MDFFTYLLKSTAILSLFFLVDFFFLKKETLFKHNRYFLLAGIVCALGFPFLEFTHVTYMEAAPTSFNVNEITIENHNSIKEENFDWIQLLFSIYLVGVVFMFIRFIIQLCGLLKILNLPKRKDTEGFYHIELIEKLSPFSFFKYIAYHLKFYNKNELDFIIQHEKIHGRQYHSIDVLCNQVILILFWFNPLAWFYQKRILENLEFIADNEISKDKDIQQKNYELTLLKVATNYQAPTLANHFYQSFIKKRIVMLNKKQSRKYVFLKSMLILPLLGFFLWSFNVKEKVEYYPSANKEISEKVSSTPIHIIKSSTTNQEIEQIKMQLEADLEGTEIRFSNIERNNEHQLINLSIEIKFETDNHFREVTNAYSNPIGTYTFQADGKNVIISFSGLTTTVHPFGSTTNFDTEKYNVETITSGEIPKNPECNTIYVHQ